MTTTKRIFCAIALALICLNSTLAQYGKRPGGRTDKIIEEYSRPLIASVVVAAGAGLGTYLARKKIAADERIREAARLKKTPAGQKIFMKLERRRRLLGVARGLLTTLGLVSAGVAVGTSVRLAGKLGSARRQRRYSKRAFDKVLASKKYEPETLEQYKTSIFEPGTSSPHSFFIASQLPGHEEYKVSEVDTVHGFNLMSMDTAKRGEAGNILFTEPAADKTQEFAPISPRQSAFMRRFMWRSYVNDIRNIISTITTMIENPRFAEHGRTYYDFETEEEARAEKFTPEILRHEYTPKLEAKIKRLQRSIAVVEQLIQDVFD